MNRVKTCEVCDETKDVNLFSIEEGERTNICKACAGLFNDAIEDMGDDFTPADELKFPDEDE